ncbi:hypothetical protein D5086_002466 [Populus alba]|uniref:Uncharacterized protein n=1 Tax=Populus alba TaxID=43335 RepID=A0ACC4D1M2_POPAL
MCFSTDQVLGQELYAWSELHIETSSLPDRYSARYGSSKNTGSTSQLMMGPVKSHGGGLRGDKDEGGDATLGDEKRKIFTGPNPLHNR